MILRLEGNRHLLGQVGELLLEGAGLLTRTSLAGLEIECRLGFLCGLEESACLEVLAVWLFFLMLFLLYNLLAMVILSVLSCSVRMKSEEMIFENF